jgi:hypothetical protein
VKKASVGESTSTPGESRKNFFGGVFHEIVALDEKLAARLVECREVPQAAHSIQ